MIKRLSAVFFVILTGYLAGVEALTAGKRFIQGQPLKEFETIQKDDFCAKNVKGGESKMVPYQW